jgi:hypothetical protein
VQIKLMQKRQGEWSEYGFGSTGEPVPRPGEFVEARWFDEKIVIEGRVTSVRWSYRAGEAHVIVYLEDI